MHDVLQRRNQPTAIGNMRIKLTKFAFVVPAICARNLYRVVQKLTGFES